MRSTISKLQSCPILDVDRSGVAGFLVLVDLTLPFINQQLWTQVYGRSKLEMEKAAWGQPAFSFTLFDIKESKISKQTAEVVKALFDNHAIFRLSLLSHTGFKGVDGQLDAVAL